jgi:predicted phage-related endonuclease
LITHSLVQGTPEWHQFRATHFGASEAAAMLGLSPKVKRTELLHMKHTGSAKEFSDWVQKNILDYGHEVEAMARPLIEEVIGADLYPVTCSDGNLSASCDGLTMAETTVFEHKQWNEALATSVRAGVVPDEHMPQCQQLLMITGAERVKFTVSDGTPERIVYTDVLPDAGWFQRIRDGWAQFEKDLATYAPVEYADKPQAEAIMRLPSLAVQIRGEVVTSNLPAFRDAATVFIANIKTDLETDEDFVNADATVKFCGEAEDSLEAARSAALGQTASIDELMKTIDFLKVQFRTKRLALKNLVDTKKASIKEAAIAKVKADYTEHIQGLEIEIEPVKLVIQPGPDFPGAAKNKRTLASLHDSLNTELANAKIKADAAAKLIRANLTWYEDNVDDCEFLFADLAVIGTKAADDFHLLVRTRIQAHQAAEEKRKQDEKDAQTAATEVISQASKAAPDPMPFVQRASPLFEVVSAPSPGGDRSVPDRNSQPSLKLGQISERLGFALTAEFLRQLGFEHAARDRSALLYHESDFCAICTALVEHITATSYQHRKAA